MNPIGSAFLLACLLGATACSEDEATEVGPAGHDAGLDAPAQATLGTISVGDLAATLATKEYLLVNVHTPYEGEIPNTDAVISYQNAAAIEAFAGPDLGVKLVVYCMSNAMSSSAGKALVADGYQNVRYLEGGMGAWKSAGHALEFHDQ